MCIYGATSAGVVAAVAAARMGYRVLLIEPGRHVGGMTTAGLGATDFGNKSVVGGIAREFYRRVGAAYGIAESWIFEPKVAARVFHDMLREANVTVLTGHRIVEVSKQAATIVTATFEHAPTDHVNAHRASRGTPLQVKARIYLDCTYEGDLMARAGVTYHVGREATHTYAEPLNGVTAAMQGHQFLIDVDPYSREGDPTSPLLPLVDSAPLGNGGSADTRIQAYNFRLCFTKRPENRLPHHCPPDYDPHQFALLGRYLQKLQSFGHEMKLHRVVMAISPMPGGKTDINNSGPFSTDCIGMNWQYTQADYPLRGHIWRQHLHYTQSLIYYLATDPGVPGPMRTEMSSWGRCRDEFTDTDGWPHQLYVREARRMIGPEVITQHTCEHRHVATDPIAMAAYKMDSHNVRRLVVHGAVRNEGNVEVAPAGPYGISYGSITPRPAECDNLLVPVCLSASHIAYGSLRMEPVFMVLGQSAALAAHLAIRCDIPVQTVNRHNLRDELLSAGQVLHHTGPAVGPMNEVFVEQPAERAPAYVASI